ncbi:hypothetical protein T4E_8174 [Trichinella pseudospiralis]|uniref:Uncharacterized protein n=1 Tax=Trichinella pseudospiralis TaxID=6337 RepID=A0A0V0XYQ4_TRIPS|nr:hypothetical protein T4E_8174 [Trichinella pseudospiralis]
MCNFQHWLEWTPNCADEASFWNVFRNKVTACGKSSSETCYGSRSCLSRKAVTCVIINNAAFGLIKESNGIKLSITNGVSRHETSNNLWQSAFFIKSAGVSWNDHKMVFQSEGEPGCCNGAFLKCDANPFQISAMKPNLPFYGQMAFADITTVKQNQEENTGNTLNLVTLVLLLGSVQRQ